jgi:exopolysaccharide biosynthesis protein
MRCLNRFVLFIIILACKAHAAEIPGLTYNTVYTENNTQVHILTIDSSKVKIVAARAQDAGQGMATVKDIAEHFNAIAAVNGGFFRFNDPESAIGLPAGALKINNQWLGIAYKARGAIAWDPASNQVLFDVLQTQSKRVNAKLQVKPLPQLNPATANAWEKMPYVVSGGPLLIHKSKIITDYSGEKLRSDFIDDRHARTAVGVLADKNWVFVVAERSILDENTGLTIAQLSKLMQSLGCVSALNLDGGGSSSMYVKNEIIDNISFGRPVADVLLVMPR